MEVLNDLLGYENLKIYQNPEWFSFSLDSVLLPNFLTLNKDVKNIIDLGTGNLPIPLILSTKTKARIVAVEIQSDIYKLACKTLKYNKLENQIFLYNLDILELPNYFEAGSFDVVVSNPPYFKQIPSSNVNLDIHKTIARHETCIQLDKLVSIVSYLLKSGGSFAMVYRTDRLSEVIQTLSKHSLEVKKIQFVHPKSGKNSNIVLIECTKNGKSGLKVLAPLIAHNEDGSYSDDVLRMFE